MSSQSGLVDTKTIQNNRALEVAFRRAGLDDVSSHNLRKTFATRRLNRSAAITDIQHLPGHASVKTTEKSYAAFANNEGFKQTINLLDKPLMPMLTVVFFDRPVLSNNQQREIRYDIKDYKDDFEHSDERVHNHIKGFAGNRKPFTLRAIHQTRSRYTECGPQ